MAPPFVTAWAFGVRYAAPPEHGDAAGSPVPDALSLAQTALGLLQPHLDPTDRITGLRTGNRETLPPTGGTAPYLVRTRTLHHLKAIQPRIRRCFEAGAIAAGANFELIGGDRPYAEMHHDAALAELYRRNTEAIGRRFPDLSGIDPGLRRLMEEGASTDMGNLSHVIPAIHPYIGIEALPAVNHQPEFAARCVTPSADRALRNGALALVWTVMDAAQQRALRERLIAGG